MILVESAYKETRETRTDEPWVVEQVINYFWPKETDETLRYDFGELTLAYEVDLKIVDDEELVRTDFNKRFRSSELYQAFRGKTDYYRFKHLILDVRSKCRRANAREINTHDF